MILNEYSRKIIYNYFEKIKKTSDETSNLKLYKKITVRKFNSISQNETQEITEVIKELQNWGIKYTSLTSPKYILFQSYKISPEYNIELKIIFYDDSYKRHYEEITKYIHTVLLFLYNEKIKSTTLPTPTSNLKLFIVMSPLKKEFRFFSNEIIGKQNVNSGYCLTNISPLNRKIVIYRKEEWSKVLIHELIHNFELDFSNDSVLSNFAKDSVKKTFLNIDSIVNLFEAYTESIAEIIYLLFILEKQIRPPSRLNISSLFFQKFEKMLFTLQNYSVVQCITILKHNDALSGVVGKNNTVKQIFEKIYNGSLYYKEESNVLSYYVIKSIFLFYINRFLKCIEPSSDNQTIFFTNTSSKNKTKIVCMVNLLQKQNLFSRYHSFIDFAEKNVKTSSVRISSSSSSSSSSSLKMTPFDYFSEMQKKHKNTKKQNILRRNRTFNFAKNKSM
jgi:hypothetical protein